MISAAPSVMAWPKYNPGRFPMSSGRRLSRCCPLVIPEQYDDGNIGGSQAVVERPSRPAISFRPLSMCCAPGVSGGHCRRHLAARVQSTPISSNGGRRGCLFACGEQGWRSTTRWKESRGIGRVWMESKAKLRWRRTRSEIIRQIGGKKGTKRSLLVDGRGAPLSLIVAGANRHDVKLLAATLDAISLNALGQRVVGRRISASTKATRENRLTRRYEIGAIFLMCRKRVYHYQGGGTEPGVARGVGWSSELIRG